MAVYIYTGKLGGGKSLCAVGRIKDALDQGKRVVTNLDIYLDQMFHANGKNINIQRIPDKPTIDDLNIIGKGNDSYDETLNGLLVLDECGTWFNSRNWQDKSRQAVNEWFLHARKLGWDVILIIQDISILDSQARAAIAEMTAFCRRLDRIQVPWVGSIYKALTGKRLSGPKIHSARIVYGTDQRDLLADRHVYRGTDLYKCYDTKQAFMDSYSDGVYSLLTPWHTKGRYQVTRDKDFYMRMTKIYLKRFNKPVLIAVTAFFSMFLTATLAYAISAQKFETVSHKTQISSVFKPPVISSPSELEGYQYSGMQSINDKVTYFFDHESKPTLTSHSRVLKGLQFTEVTYCVIEVFDSKTTLVLQCPKRKNSV